MTKRTLAIAGLACGLGLALACGDDDVDPYCGDGIVQYEEGELCDDGSDNGYDGRCGDDCRFNPGACPLDEARACEGRCGDLVAFDSCGAMALARCGDCTGEGEVCGNDHVCAVPEPGEDAGSDGEDAGVEPDASTDPDAGEEVDAGADEDASVIDDAGSDGEDAGEETDASDVSDVDDAGEDAGVDEDASVADDDAGADGEDAGEEADASTGDDAGGEDAA